MSDHLIGLNRGDRAIQYLRKQIDEFPAPPLLIQLAKIYFATGQVDKMKAVLEKLSEAFPENMESLAMLALVYLSEGDYDKAINTAKKSLEKGNSPISHSAIGIGYTLKDDPSTALQYFKTTLQLNPKLEFLLKPFVEQLENEEEVPKELLFKATFELTKMSF